MKTFIIETQEVITKRYVIEGYSEQDVSDFCDGVGYQCVIDEEVLSSIVQNWKIIEVDEDIEFCYEWAVDNGDIIGAYLASRLILVPMKDRIEYDFIQVLF